MHDVLEGSLSYEIKELIRWLVSEEKVLTLAELNEAISSFPYWGSDAKDKPCPFGTTLLTSNDHGLRLTGEVLICVFVIKITCTHACSYTNMVLGSSTATPYR